MCHRGTLLLSYSSSYVITACVIATLVVYRFTSVGNYFWAPGTEFGPAVRVLLGGIVQHKGRFLRMLHGLSRELSIPFFQSLGMIFGAASQFSLGGQNYY